MIVFPPDGAIAAILWSDIDVDAEANVTPVDGVDGCIDAVFLAVPSVALVNLAA